MDSVHAVMIPAITMGSHHGPALRLGGHEITDHVIGEHTRIAEEHPHPAGAAWRRGDHAGTVEHDRDLHPGARGERAELPDEPGTLVGEGFVTQWNNRRVYDLYALVRGTMPLDNPAGLKDGEYLDVIAYLLRANKHASAAPDSLRADTASLRARKISVGS